MYNRFATDGMSLESKLQGAEHKTDSPKTPLWSAISLNDASLVLWRFSALTSTATTAISRKVEKAHFLLCEVELPSPWCHPRSLRNKCLAFWDNSPLYPHAQTPSKMHAFKTCCLTVSVPPLKALYEKIPFPAPEPEEIIKDI